MNDPTPAAGATGEAAAAAPGAEPELSLNPHMGHLVPPEGDETPAPEADKDKAKDGDSPPPAEGDSDPNPDDPPVDKKAKRIEELAFENRQQAREIERLKRGQQPKPDDPGGEQPKPEDKPEKLKTLKDFDYDEQAHAQYLIEKGAELAEKRAAAKTEKDSAETEAQTRQDEFDARVEAFDADHPGFKDRLHADDLQISREMAAFIADPESEVGFHVGDYLSQNKAEAAKIAAMSPTAQMREMTKLETKISGELAKAKAAKKETSKAPEPPANPVDGTDPGTVLDPANPADADKMSDAEWLEARNKQLNARK